MLLFYYLIFRPKFVTMIYIDIHTHQYAPGENIKTIENIHDQFNQIPANRPVSVGLHPWWLENADEKMDQLRQLVYRSNVLAIGECGLDKLSETDWQKQIKYFEAQMELAQEADKPLIIHCVRAFSEAMGILHQTRVPVIFHGINKKFSVIKPLLDSGYYLSFGKALLGDNETVKETLMETPLNRLFLETDDSGRSIKEIFKVAAEIRNVSENEIALQIQKNYSTVFRHAKH